MTNKLLTLGFIALINLSLVAQTFNAPESMIYDSQNDRYIISNVNGNTIFTLSNDGELAKFVTEGLGGPKALLITGDTLLSMNHKSVQGFSLADTSKVMHIDVNGSEFMNGAALDGKGNLFVTDMNKHCVYRINLKTGAYNIFNDDLNSPNGLHFDAENNRILVVSWGGNAKIQAINLSDSVLSDLVTTKLSNLDGICSDDCGNIYVSSWGKNAVYVYEPNFTKAPTKIAESLSGPADISIREDNQTLLVPKFNANAVEIIELGMSCAQIVNYTSPENKSTEMETSVTLEWETVEAANSYNIEYSTDEMFYAINGSVLTEELSAMIEDLDPATTYFWRVAATIDDTKTFFSDVWRFTTAESTVGLNTTLNNAITIFPNPCDAILNFSKSVNHVSVVNISGQEVYSSNEMLRQLNISDLNAGVYFISFLTKEHMQITKKILRK